MYFFVSIIIHQNPIPIRSEKIMKNHENKIKLRSSWSEGVTRVPPPPLQSRGGGGKGTPPPKSRGRGGTGSHIGVHRGIESLEAVGNVLLGLDPVSQSL